MNEALEKVLAKKILTIGEPVLSSELFHKGYWQTHHKICSVGEHTLNVTTVALAHAMRINRGEKKVREDVVILAGLCHDLGIIGRDEKYKNDFQCGQCHAGDSVICAKEILPNLDEMTIDSIQNHMWPVTKTPPHYREGFLILSADKFSATAEWLAYLSHRDIHGKAKELIRKACMIKK